MLKMSPDMTLRLIGRKQKQIEKITQERDSLIESVKILIESLIEKNEKLSLIRNEK